MASEIRILMILLLALPALAGCLGAETSETDDSSNRETTDVGSGSDDAREEVVDVPLVGEPFEVTYYLASDGTLAREPPSAGHINQGSFLADYFQGAVDAQALSLRSDALRTAMIVHRQPVEVTLWIESDTPQPPIPGFDGVGGFAFFGSTKGMPLLTFHLTDPVFVPGAPVRYDFRLEFRDFAPLVVPARESFSLLAGLAASTLDAAPARILVGGDHASAITFTASNLTKDILANLPSPVVETFTGVVEKQGDPRPDHAHTIGANTTELQIEIRLTGGREADLDLDLFDAGGRHIAGSHTPSTYESIYLLGPALDGLRGAPVTIRVGHFHPVNAEYEITVTQR